ncbi:uncharacterized protein [Procambarus clarkii]|uniref:uncharacterized protein n=1 Tax=Procambarus clarkii TaxID=6728 RepID=UPI0037449565
MVSSRHKHIFTLCSVLLLLLMSVDPTSGWARRNFIEDIDSSGDGDGEDGGDVNGDGGTDEEIFRDMNDSNSTGNKNDEDGQPQPYPYCQQNTTYNESMVCDFSNTKEMVKVPDNLQQLGIKELKINKANDLDFQPLCLNTIDFNHCKINHIDYGHGNHCHHLLQINIYNSTVNKLAGKYKIADIFQSDIHHLDIAFSSTGDLPQDTIPIWNVVIIVLSKLTVVGSKILKMNTVVIGKIHEGGLTINTLWNTANTIRSSAFSSVETGGILVKEGELLIEDTSINDLAAEGIKVTGNGSLIMKNVIFQNTHTEGVVIETGGKALFYDVVLEGSPFAEKYIEFPGMKVYPFVQTMVDKQSDFASTSLGIFVISLAVVLVIALIGCAVCKFCACPNLRNR